LVQQEPIFAFLAISSVVIAVVCLVFALHRHREVTRTRLLLEEGRRRHRELEATLATQAEELTQEIDKSNRSKQDLLILSKGVTTTGVGITVTDLDGRILFTNPAQAEMHGSDVDDRVGAESSVLAPEGIRQPTALKSFADGESFRRESQNIRQDGTVFPVALTTDTVFDDAGTPLARVTVSEDISNRKMQRDELQLRGAALGAISEAATRFLVVGDWTTGVEETLAVLGAALSADSVFALKTVQEDGSITGLRMRYSWGVAFEDATTWSRGEVEPISSEAAEEFFSQLAEGTFLWGGVEAAEPLPPALRRRWPHQSFLLQPVRTGEGWWGIVGVSCRTTEQMYSVARVESLATAGRLLGAALTRKRGEETLRLSEARFRGLFEASSDLIQLVDLEGRFLFVNQAWQAALGYTDEEIPELRQMDLVAPEEKNTFREIFQRMQAGEKQERVETCFVCRDGRLLDVEGSSTTEAREAQVSIRCIFRDISHRKEIERMKGEFIAMVSHELRTPLTSIHASLRILGKRLGESQERELVDIAQQNSEDLNHLVDDIIDLKRLEAGRLVFEPGMLNLQELVDRALETSRAYALRLGVKLRHTLRQEDLRVWTDGNRLTQVLTNLLSNAAKFSPEGSVVSVSVHRIGDRARVEVCDQGPGIPVEQRKRVFKKFSQLAPVETRRGRGTGLGLSIAKSIIEQLGGSIDFFSPNHGGAVFFIELPLRTGERP